MHISAEFVIPKGEALSSPLDLAQVGSGAGLQGVLVPRSWPPEADKITFQVSQDGATWFDLRHALGAEVWIIPTPGAAHVFPLPEDFRFLRLRAGTSDDPIAQESAQHIAVSLVRGSTR